MAPQPLSSGIAVSAAEAANFYAAESKTVSAQLKPKPSLAAAPSSAAAGGALPPVRVGLQSPAGRELGNSNSSVSEL